MSEKLYHQDTELLKHSFYKKIIFSKTLIEKSHGKLLNKYNLIFI